MANEFDYSVSLSIVHPRMDPRRITATISSLRPRIETSAGSARRGKDGKLLIPRRAAALSHWLADLQEGKLNSKVTPISAFISEQLTRLEHHRDFLREIRKDGDVVFRIGWFSSSNYSAGVLEAEVLKKCGDLGIDIEINCYFSPSGERHDGLIEPE